MLKDVSGVTSIVFVGTSRGNETGYMNWEQVDLDSNSDSIANLAIINPFCTSVFLSIKWDTTTL